MPETAELTEAVFKLRVAEGGRVDADFVLTMRTPEGVEHWGCGWDLHDVGLEPARGRSLRELFDPFMRSLFDDHLYDMSMAGLVPDRGYDELSIRLEVPDEILHRMGIESDA
jgi:hypothetical protein